MKTQLASRMPSKYMRETENSAKEMTFGSHHIENYLHTDTQPNKKEY